MTGRPWSAVCPVCQREVPLGLLGRVLPWHRRDPSWPQRCPGEGTPVNQTQEASR